MSSAKSVTSGVLAALRKLARKVLPLRILEMRAKAAEVRRHREYQNLPIEKVFARIYQGNEWGGEDGFYSGTGSHDPAIVVPYVQAVRAVLSKLANRPVVVDVGSGDFNVGSQFVCLVARYYACDIVADLQAFNRQKYAFDNVEFLCVNAVDDELPAGDVIIIRQVLQHLSNAQIQKILEKCHRFPRWVITEHVPASPSFVPNRDIGAGCGIRILFDSGVDLLAPPFSVQGYSHRLLCEVAEHGGIIRTTLFEHDSCTAQAEEVA